jgi:alginate O-acetyltransferase complex protein AlgJ
MKKLIFRSVLFFSPLLLALSLELFVLPVDFFAFRVWEGLIIKKYRWILAGRFYPRRDISKMETGGDLGLRGPSASRRHVRWITDQYGYRKKNSGATHYEVVIIGDSNIAGIGLSQEETLSEVLEDRLNAGVYPFAPSDMNTFLKDRHFMDDPPEVVIVSSIERDIYNLPYPKLRREAWPTLSNLKFQLQKKGWVQAVGVFLDRLFKMNMMNYFRARIGNGKHREFCRSSTPFGTMDFLQGGAANESVSTDRIEGAVRTIEAYDRVLKEKGIHFIFLPIPNKENIYYQYLPDSKRPTFLETLIAELKRKKIETVDTQKAFEEKYRKDLALLYRLDDTHWNPAAVRITADLIQESIPAFSKE